MSGTSMVVGAVAVAVVVGVVLLYNRLVQARVRVDEAWAQVDTELQRRHDLVPSLVASVAAYADHERAALEAVIDARARAIATADPAARADAEGALGDALAGLLAVTEAYPDLRADAAFRDLAGDLSDTEQRLAFARDFASHRVGTYHGRLDTFPSVLVARAFRFERATFFAVADAAARRVPAIELEQRP